MSQKFTKYNPLLHRQKALKRAAIAQKLVTFKFTVFYELHNRSTQPQARQLYRQIARRTERLKTSRK